MSPFRISIHTYGAVHGQATVFSQQKYERIVPPEERLISGNGPVLVYVENGKRLKVPKVVR